jgi:nucleoside-diphosphate-sugar epimerase
VDRAVEGCQAVIHLVAGAPPNWAGFEKLFVEGTRSVAESCIRHNVKQLLFASSICALYLGRPKVTVSDKTPIDPHPERRCDYARAKILCERLLMEMHRDRQLPVTILRPGIVVGGGGPVTHLGVGTWPAPTHCVSWGCGDHGLPFVLVDDVSSAFVAALGKTGIAGQAFNLVGDVRLSAAEYIQAVREESGRDVQLHRRSVLEWKILENLIWSVKAVARKSDNTALSYRELAYRTAASPIDCTATKHTLGWQPVADREQFIELGIRQALAE